MTQKRPTIHRRMTRRRRERMRVLVTKRKEEMMREMKRAKSPGRRRTVRRRRRMSHQLQEARQGSGDQGRIRKEAVSEKNSEAFV